jgi:predicted deacylase
MVFRIGETSASLGEKAFGKLRIATLLSGSVLEIPFHIANGTKPGPKLLLTSASHGEEFLQAEGMRRFYFGLNPKELSGTVILVPVLNPLGFQYATHNNPIDMEGICPGAFPGDSNSYLTDRLIHTICADILKKVDYVIDLHGGEWGSACYFLELLEVAGISRKVQKATYDLAVAFGLDRIMRKTQIPPNTPVTYAQSIGIPSIIAEVGGGGWGAEANEFFFNKCVMGIRNAMIHLEMIKGEIVPPAEQIIWQSYSQTRFMAVTSHGGYHIPAVGIEKLIGGVEIIPKGKQLATIVSPYTFEELERFVCPFDGIINIMGGFSTVEAAKYLSWSVGDLKAAQWLKKRAQLIDQ